MKINISLVLILILHSSCSNENSQEQDVLECAGDLTTAGVLVNIREEIYNGDESVNTNSKYSWSSEGSDRILIGNGIPNHEVGTFPNPNNPNTIRKQNVSKRFTLCPEIVSKSGLELVGPALAIAYALNSVKFDPGTAGRCNDAGECSLAQGQGNWNIEALGHDTFDFGDDMNHAHVQPNGEYHYHGMPELLIEFLGNSKGMTIVGWASDGFPVYARNGFFNADDSNSQVVALQSSYRLKSQPDANRPSTLTTLIGGPGQGSTNLNIPIPMGAFTQDFEYIQELGDLDQCNGRFGVTPEFPKGIYYYVISDDFPFFTRCLKGKF